MWSKHISSNAGPVALAVLLAGGCDALYPRAFTGQVVTDDQRVDVPCTLSLYEALDTPNPILISTAAISTGKRFQASVQSEKATRTPASKLWVSYNCEGYFPRVRGFDAEHLSVWEKRVVDLGTVTVERWKEK